MFMKTLLIAVFSFVFMLPSGAIAQDHGVFCEGSESTAATRRCLNRHLGAAQDRLSKLYEKLSATLDGENLENLQGLQKSWLAYRDGQCEWEAGQTDVQSLERVNKLSCLARMSEDRADVLEVILADEALEGAPRQFGDFPRWMNVLAKDEPDVFWNYGKKQQADLDCDGENEMVMTGIRAKKIEDFSDGGRGSLVSHGLTFILAIAENPPTGRPQTYIVPLVVGVDICAADASLRVEEEVPKKEGEETTEKKPKKCATKLTLEAKGCDPVSVIWSGKSYEVEPEEKLEEADKNKKKTKKEK